MQAVMETVFDACYLLTVIFTGFIILRKANKNPMLLFFGIMAVTLGVGDAFHLIPRAYALCTDGLAAHTTALGIGKFITSITMTVFYVLLYHIWEMRYTIYSSALRISIYMLAIIRIALCFFPQNAWTSAQAPIMGNPAKPSLCRDGHCDYRLILPAGETKQRSRISFYVACHNP